jgi:broad specificity phosphatase PhoE
VGEEPTTLVLVRHGRTAWTGEGRICGGDTEGPPLTERGRRELAALAVGLGERLAAPRRSGRLALLTSPTLRTRQSAAVLAGAWGLDPGDGPTVDPGWSELRFGDWHGLGYAEAAAAWPREYGQWQRLLLDRPPGGESLDELGARVGMARDAAVAAHPGGTLVVLTHTGPIRGVVRAALDAGPAALWRLRVDPASATTLTLWPDGGLEVVAVNEAVALSEAVAVAES